VRAFRIAIDADYLSNRLDQLGIRVNPVWRQHMASDDSNGQTPSETPTPHPGLKALNRLVGTWKVSGETEGETTYEWMEGGFFLIQRGEVKREGEAYRYLQIIGYDRGPGAEPADAITGRLYTNRGDTLDYTYEGDDRNVTIWFGQKGSPSFYKGRWSDDGNALSGAWEWPGGGYKETMTRLEPRPPGAER